jgi:hypothetical protein
MHALVIFESMFGNTRVIAEAIADGLSSRFETDLIEVGAAPKVIYDNVELLVVGGPTHAFGMSRPGTRQTAAEQAGNGADSDGIGQREWLDAVQGGSERVAAAAFDTRLDKPHWLVGSAARAYDKRLRRLGFRVSSPPQSFFVAGTPGPLLDGEAERARRWGLELASQYSENEEDSENEEARQVS